MPLITFDCPQCRKVLKSATPIPPGTAIRCPTCGASFAMQTTSTAPATGRRRSRGVWIAGLAILFLLGGLGGGYYFFRDRIDPPRPESPLAYVPPDAEIIAGIDFTVLLDDALLGPGIDRGIRDLVGDDFLQRCQRETGLSPKELLGHAIVAGKLKPSGAAMQPALFSTQAGQLLMAPTVILQTTKPIDPEKVARAAQNPVRRTAHDKTYFELNEGELRTLYMPSDRIIVLSTRPASELDALFASEGKLPSISGDMTTLVKAVDRNSLWAVVPVEGQVRDQLQHLIQNDKLKGNADSLSKALANSKGVALWGTPDGTNLTFGATVLCPDSPTAQVMKAGVEDAWKQQKPQMDLAALLLGSKLPKTYQVYKAVAESLRFSTDGALVGATTTVSRQGVEEFHKELESNPALVDVLGKLSGLLPKGAKPGVKNR